MLSNIKAFIAKHFESFHETNVGKKFAGQSAPVRYAAYVLIIMLLFSLASSAINGLYWKARFAFRPKAEAYSQENFMTLDQISAKAETDKVKALADKAKAAAPAAPAQIAPAQPAEAIPLAAPSQTVQTVVPIVAGDTTTAAAQQVISPAEPLNTIMVPNTMRRSLLRDDGKGPSPFESKDVHAYTFSGDSSFENGHPSYGTKIHTHLAGFVKIETPGNYTFAATTSGEPVHHASLSINDTEVAKDEGQTSANGQGYEAYVLSKPVSLVPGWYKVEVVIVQDFSNKVTAVSTSLMMSSTGEMRAVSPSLVSPNQVPVAPQVAAPVAPVNQAQAQVAPQAPAAPVVQVKPVQPAPVAKPVVPATPSSNDMLRPAQLH